MAGELSENVNRFRSMYDAFARGDLETGLGMLAEDIKWHVNGMSPIAGEYSGKKGVLQFFGRAMELYQGTLTVEVVDILANDERCVFLVTERGQYKGDKIEYSSVHVWSIKNGKCVKFEAYQDDRYSEFWSRHHTN